MQQNNKEQIKLLASLPDDVLTKTVRELGEMLKFNPPAFREGMSKTRYATTVMEYVEKATANLSEIENKQRTSEIMARCENVCPTLWAQVTNKFKILFSPFNLKTRNN